MSYTDESIARIQRALLEDAVAVGFVLDESAAFHLTSGLVMRGLA